MEEYIAVCKKHWALVLGRLLLALLIFGFLPYGEKGNTGYQILRFALPLLVLLSGIIEYTTNYIAVTRTKIVVHMGFIKTTDYSTPLNKIQAISISSGLFGKMFGYHTITIDHAGTGRSEYKFGHMANAKDFVFVLERMTGIR